MSHPLGIMNSNTNYFMRIWPKSHQNVFLWKKCLVGLTKLEDPSLLQKYKMYSYFHNSHFIFSEALVLNSPTLKVYFPWSSFLTSLTDRVCLPRREDMTCLLLGESIFSLKNQLPSASSRDTTHSNSPEYVSGTSVLSSCFRISSGAPVYYIIHM